VYQQEQQRKATIAKNQLKSGEKSKELDSRYMCHIAHPELKYNIFPGSSRKTDSIIYSEQWSACHLTKLKQAVESR
jgi:hypothetical protein